MENNEKIDISWEELHPINYFYFVEPHGELYSSYRYPIPRYEFDSESFETILKKLRSKHVFDYLPDGTYAVILYQTCYNEFVYLKTIKHRRKSFDLSCDSE